MVNGRHAWLVFIFAILAALALMVSGCDKATLDSGNAASSTPSNSASKTKKQTLSADKEEDLKKQNISTSKTMDVVLYFSDDQAQKLIKETRSVPETDAVARITVEELMKGPEEGGVATIPTGTKLLGIVVEDGLAKVDFSEEFIDNHPGGSAGEEMTVYSIVDTLTEISNIKRVKFLVEGVAIDTITGHMDVGQPIEREESFF